MFYATSSPQTSYSRHRSRSRRRSSSYHKSGNRTRSRTRHSELETEYETRQTYNEPPSYGQPVYYTSPAHYTPVPEHSSRERRSSYERTSRYEYVAQPEYHPPQTTYYRSGHTSRSEYERDYSYHARLRYSSSSPGAGYAASYTRTSPRVRFAAEAVPTHNRHSASRSDKISVNVTFVNLGDHSSSREVVAGMRISLDKDRHGNFISPLRGQIEAGVRAVARTRNNLRIISAEHRVYSIYMKYERKPEKNRELVALDNDEAMRHLMSADRKGKLEGIEVLYKDEL